MPLVKSSKVAFWLSVLCLPALALAQPENTAGLVDKLATTNPPAVVKGKPGRQEATFDSDFDLSESKRIDGVAKEALRDVEDIWLELVKHLDDDRHCKTVGIDAGYPRNWSVGDACQHLIGETLSEPYFRQIPSTKSNFNRFRLPAVAKDKAKLREWCLARKDRKLFELQIELCGWAITEIKRSNMSDAEKSRITAAIEKEIEALQESKTAVHVVAIF
jgi:hypothetical protein